MASHDFETFTVAPIRFTLGATGFASAETTAATKRLAAPASRNPV
jgi:hypothetical protein